LLLTAVAVVIDRMTHLEKKAGVERACALGILKGGEEALRRVV